MHLEQYTNKNINLILLDSYLIRRFVIFPRYYITKNRVCFRKNIFLRRRPITNRNQLTKATIKLYIGYELTCNWNCCIRLKLLPKISIERLKSSFCTIILLHPSIIGSNLLQKCFYRYKRMKIMISIIHLTLLSSISWNESLDFFKLTKWKG